ncbi:MAG: hypothetical protein A2293_00255 [Elusimicrobia bacterium RIFOXYB2_FULL_49_7]|nr:MAG: hypothetical protein A2293_00255 [Elusimicrobia bacterium RIFOXYB2_FULL_49_7]
MLLSDADLYFGGMNLTQELQKRLSRNAVEDAPETCAVYSYDASKQEASPSAVVYATSAEDVISAVNVARKLKTSVVPRGAGSGLTGGAVPLEKAIVLDMERMNQILHIDPEKRFCIVEPGLINADLQVRLRKYGLFFPCDPGSAAYCTLGGNVAENACGIRGRYYGSCFSHILGLEYVNSDGRLLSTGFFNEGKNTTLQDLLLGSEGTFGIITRLALKLEPIPEAFNTFFLLCKERRKAFEIAEALLREGLIPLALEYADKNTASLVLSPRSPYHRKWIDAFLLIETAAGEKKVENLLDTFHHVERIKAANTEERQAIWDLRNDISPTLYRVAPCKLNEDVGVPSENMALFGDFLSELEQTVRRVRLFTFGHLGAGCFHVNVMFDEADPEARPEADMLVQRVFEKTISLNGTLSSEHGIGLTKKEYLPLELSGTALAFHKAIKIAFDPDGRFNPGKIFPENNNHD